MNSLITINPKADLSRPVLQKEADRLAQGIISGEVDPVSAYIHLKAITETVGQVMKDEQVRDAVHQAIDKYDRKNPDDCKMHGAKFEIRNLPDAWDFSKDAEWVELDKHMRTIKAKMKAREDFLKAAYKAGAGFDPDTGEAINVSRVVRGQSVVITLGK